MNIQKGDRLLPTPSFREEIKSRLAKGISPTFKDWLSDGAVLFAVNDEEIGYGNNPVVHERSSFPSGMVIEMRQAWLDTHHPALVASNGRKAHGWLGLNVVSPDGTKERIRFDAVNVAPTDVLMTIEETMSGRSEAILLLLTPGQQRGLRDYLNDLLEGE